MANRFLEEARQGENAFWRYLVTLFLIIAFAIGGTLVALIIGFLLEGTADLTAFSNITYLFVTMSTFPFALVSLWLGINWLHRRPLMSLINPERRIRWKRVLLSAGVWVALSALSDVVFAVLRPGLYTWSFDWKLFLPYALPALILIPIQTATEELIFRGYLTQGFGLLARGLLLPLVGPAILFGLLHGANPEVTTYGALLTLPTYVLMGLLLGWITLKSESLELALGLHTGNNLYAALAVTFPASAIPSPALFTVKQYGLED
jgi:membrane protease YdiL (CAAX protease family)